MEIDSLTEMRVEKRNGGFEYVSFDKILKRVKKICQEFNISINPTPLVIKVIEQLHDNIKTSFIDELTAEQAISMSTTKQEYGKLASALVVSNLQKMTSKSFSDTMEILYNYHDSCNNHVPLISKELIECVRKNNTFFDNLIDFSRDFNLDYFGFKTLTRAYLMKTDKIIRETPQFMWLRVAICIHHDNLENVKTTYDKMSMGYFTHATPTLFNAGTPRPQLSSCFLISMEDDSVDGIFNTLKECANISKWAGGIGLHIHNIRAKGSLIRGTNGTSNGIVPMLGVFNKTARYIDQGGGRRNGSFAIYLEPHHADIVDFLDLKKNHGDEESKARDLFYALWVSDLFMERVRNNSEWSLFCPDTAPGLSDCYGDNYKNLYEKYESENKQICKMNARDLWVKILDSQMETGTPYILYKDSINKKSNQKNIGVIKSSNLCTEITEYSDKDETAVCNLASIGLSKFVKNPEHNYENSIKVIANKNCILSKMGINLLKKRNIQYIVEYSSEKDESLPKFYYENKLIGNFDDMQNSLRMVFDYEELYNVVKIATENLNRVIDINYYPTPKTKKSNLRHRPIGLGVQGLADVFILMDISFDSEKAKQVNIDIFKTIYYAALEKSMELAKERESKIKFLKQQYYYNNWDFANSDDMCTEYIVYNNSEASLHNTLVLDSEIEKILNSEKPIREEIINDSDEYCGAYSTFKNSPVSKGILQYHLWERDPDSDSNLIYDWDNLIYQIQNYGVRNSLLVAPMPTASTSQILGNNECFEPMTSNIYTRRTLAGEFVIINKYLIDELSQLEIWNPQVKDNIILNKGSIQMLPLPKQLKDKYKIVWEMSMKTLINMAADRGAYIDQSQSLNLWLEDPDVKSLTNMHFYSWDKGLKTGIYYLRRKPKHQPQQFTIDPSSINNDNQDCLMCSG